uniref:Transmembrane protein n=2 Tax=Parascaris univalens TaxID=6257 RepID=A0A915AX44_PARUN
MTTNPSQDSRRLSHDLRRLSQDPRRTSVSFRQSYCEGHGSFCSGSNAKCPLHGSLNVSARKRAVNSTGGQLFLCVIGSLLSFSICVWLTAFSQDLQWRRMLFAAGAALCALLFAMLAMQTMRRAKQTLLDETIPNLAHRRSTIAKSTARKSACSGIIREDSESAAAQQREPTSVVVASTDKKASLTPLT